MYHDRPLQQQPTGLWERSCQEGEGVAAREGQGPGPGQRLGPGEAREGAREGEKPGEGAGAGGEGEAGAREGAREGEGPGKGKREDREGEDREREGAREGERKGPRKREAGERADGEREGEGDADAGGRSGCLWKHCGTSGLVRPSAFKPVVPKSFHSMQNLGKTDARVVQGGMSDSGRNSLTSLPTYTGSGSGCGPPAVLGPLSASTSHINRLGMAGAASCCGSVQQNGLSASDSGRSSSGKSSSSYQRLSHLSDAPAPLRPSPSSDDIIQDLEDRLWEKEQEVRGRLEIEAAIIQVFEEKQRVWERQMDELRQNYASRLQQVTRRAQRSQTALQAQITRLSQDKRRLQEEMAALLAQREELERKCLDYRKEQADILPRLEETKWEVCQKAGEISLLKQQLRESQAEVTQRAGEMVALRGQLKELNAQLREREEVMLGLKDSYSTKCLELEKCEGELRRTLSELRQEAQLRHEAQMRQELRQEAHQPQRAQEGHWDEAGELRRQLEQLQGVLRLERQQRERQALNFDQERHTWQDEKERVLKYQAQLQLSYVETLQKNQALEKRMSQLGTKQTTVSTTTIKEREWRDGNCGTLS
uniref:Leucine zipper, putative tumor suppressor family member 3b n=1 Tax=Xiphophorus couchianus TaxID=32473 RepID=A0A3B5LDF0_9TELE